MTDINQTILNMILENASLNEICATTGLSNKQLFHRLNMLKFKGYDFSRKYYYTGDIAYRLKKEPDPDNEISLITGHNDNEIKAVFISDLHLANKKDRIDLLNQIYDFCAKENIHIIINGGDILDGFFGYHLDKKILDSQKQIDYLLKNYPYDKNILNFICLGNHDYSILKETGQNIETILSLKRHDLISLGYGIGKLNIKNEEILVKHFKAPVAKHYNDTPERLVLMGHTHRSQCVFSNNQAHIYIPSLSNMQSEKNKFPFPGFIFATLNFNNGYINNIILNQYIILDKIYKINEVQHNMCENINNNEYIKYEEDRKAYILKPKK